MNRIYCDSNIYRYLNPGHPSYSHGLLDVFESLKDKMLFTFSDAHLDDLKDSKTEFAYKDLELMGRYVKDNYFMHDLITEKKTTCYLATPLEAFKGKDYNAYNSVLQNNPFDIDKMFSDDPSDEFGFNRLLRQSLQLLYNMPIDALTPSIDTASLKRVHKEWFEKMIPNYSPTMTIQEMMNGLWSFGQGILEDAGELTAFRKYIQEYLDRDEYSFDKWGIGFNERLKQTSIGKTFTELVDFILTQDQKNDLYHRFNYTYTLLEMYNITQERQGKNNKLKKFDFQSLNTDALHAWYASFSDYLVTDDKGLQVKAAIVYQLLGLPTKIISSKDFINMKTLLLGQEETISKFIEAILFDLDNAMLLYSVENLGETVQTYKTVHPYFNYANRMQVIREQDWNNIVLYCDRSGHADFFMYRELELIINKLLSMLGIDDQNKGAFNIYAREQDKIEWNKPLRVWTKGVQQYAVGLSAKAPGNLYINLSIPKKSIQRPTQC